MANTKYGVVGWNEPTGKRDFSDSEKTPYMKFVVGKNPVRILSLPRQYLEHKYKQEGDPADFYGHWVKCASDNCPLCLRGDKAKKKFICPIIDRKTQSYKVANFGTGLYEKIKVLVNDPEWGDVTNYDVSVVMDPKASSPANFYNATPSVPKPLSPTDIEFKNKINEEALDKMCNPADADWVLARITTLREQKGLSPLVGLDKAKEATKKVDSTDDGEAEEDFTFKARD